MLKLTKYQIKLLLLLNQPEKPRYTEQELRSFGIEYDREEFRDLLNEKYIYWGKREPRRENEYHITPPGEKAITSYLKEQTEIEKNHKKACWANVFSGCAALFSLLLLILELIKIFVHF